MTQPTQHRKPAASVTVWRVIDEPTADAPTYVVESRQAVIRKDGAYKLDRPFKGLVGVVFSNPYAIGMRFHSSPAEAVRRFAFEWRRRAESLRRQAVTADEAVAWAERWTP